MFLRIGFYTIYFIILFSSCTRINPKKSANIIIKDSVIIKPKNIIPVFIIDAGHGGVDPGGINDSLHLFEKNITRNIVDAVLKEIDSTKVKVVQTRVKDANINRHIRIQNANKFNPDLLLTIHTNFDKDTTVNGFEIAFSDSSLFKIKGKDTLNQINPNKFILEKYTNSLTNNIAKSFPTMKRRLVKERRDHIWMIYAPNYPSALIEFGFITNKQDASIMSNPKEIKKLAKIIVKSVYHFFNID